MSEELVAYHFLEPSQRNVDGGHPAKPVFSKERSGIGDHSNIAGIYGLEESNGVKALVLELIEGPTLADRLQEGPIRVDEAIAIAKQIAEALEAGHEAGVIHRDLKPANIKLREDGTVKVLDYGLAKALEGDLNGGADVEISHSPTLTRQGTQLGVILGTAAYMSPEQAKGIPVDRRSDVFSFGCVLFEMLVGQRTFSGDDISLTLAAVMKDDPDWDRLPATVGTSLRWLLKRCLDKNPLTRLRDIGEARIVLSQAGEAPALETVPETVEGSHGLSTTLVIGLVVLGVAGVGLTTQADDAAVSAEIAVAPPGGGV